MIVMVDTECVKYSASIKRYIQSILISEIDSSWIIVRYVHKKKMHDVILGIANFKLILYLILELHTADCK